MSPSTPSAASVDLKLCSRSEIGRGGFAVPSSTECEAIFEKIAEVGSVGWGDEVEPRIGIVPPGSGEDTSQELIDFVERFLDTRRGERLDQTLVIHRRHNLTPSELGPCGHEQASRPQGWQPLNA